MIAPHTKRSLRQANYILVEMNFKYSLLVFELILRMEQRVIFKNKKVRKIFFNIMAMSNLKNGCH
jgi:hypothetical protein